MIFLTMTFKFCQKTMGHDGYPQRLRARMSVPQKSPAVPVSNQLYLGPDEECQTSLGQLPAQVPASSAKQRRQ